MHANERVWLGDTGCAHPTRLLRHALAETRLCRRCDPRAHSLIARLAIAADNGWRADEPTDFATLFGPYTDGSHNNAEIQYEIVKTGDNQRVLEFKEEVAKMPGASATQVTVEKILPLQNMTPGQYTLKLKVLDKNRNQTLTPVATFTVT